MEILAPLILSGYITSKLAILVANMHAINRLASANDPCRYAADVAATWSFSTACVASPPTWPQLRPRVPCGDFLLVTQLFLPSWWVVVTARCL